MHRSTPHPADDLGDTSSPVDAEHTPSSSRAEPFVMRDLLDHRYSTVDVTSGECEAGRNRDTVRRIRLRAAARLSLVILTNSS
jgi:hypothetical protein